MEKEGITFRQGLEVASWLARLSCEEYQRRRSILKKVTDPRARFSAELMHPFITPLQKGLRLEEEGPLCDDPIAIGDLEFIAGDIVGKDFNALDPNSAYTRFSQHHAEQLIARVDELPNFPDGTEIVFPGTTYITPDVNAIKFFPSIICDRIGLVMGLVARSVAFRSSCRFPYQLHTRR